MKKSLALLGIILSISFSASSQTLKEISLTDAVTGKSVNVSAQLTGKGLVLIFHSLACPFAKMYESRLTELRSKYTSQGFNFILVNPEVSTSQEDQTALRTYIDQSGINMSYLIDENQELTKYFKITKIPEVILLTPGEVVSYRGAVDNNPQAENSASSNYLDKAIDQLLKNESPSPPQARAVGCNVKTF